jgi:hypothetical protein
MERNKKCKNESCTNNALYSGKCGSCGGRNQCSKTIEDVRCTKCTYNNKEFCSEHGGCLDCVFIYTSLITGPEQCTTKRCRSGGYCAKHSIEENRDRDKKLLTKPAPVSSKSNKRKRNESKPAPVSEKRTTSESKKNEDERESKRQRNESLPAPVSSKSNKRKRDESKTVEEPIYEGKIYAKGITEADTSFNGDKFDTFFGEEGGKIVKERIDDRTILDSIKEFFSRSPFSSPKKSDGKRRRTSRGNKFPKKGSSRKSKRKSRRKSRRKSSIRNTYIKV